MNWRLETIPFDIFSMRKYEEESEYVNGVFLLPLGFIKKTTSLFMTI